MSELTVFISYSHKDEEWKDKLVAQLSVLERQWNLDIWEDRRIEAGAQWFKEIEEAINASSIGILLVSANFLCSRFITQEEIPRLLQRRQKDGIRILPIIVKPCDWQAVGWLALLQARPKDGQPLSAGSENQIEADLAAIAKEIRGLLQRAGLPRKERTFVALPPDRVFTAKLPATESNMFGREQELKTLDQSWADPRTNILSLVAWGGVGKTALVNFWLNNMGRENYRGAERVYGWSFGSQGTREDRQASADIFLEDALRWFGYKDKPLKWPWDKGVRLAELVRRQKTLLILDGLEPLQCPPGPMGGALRDEGLKALLRELVRFNPGLCVLTTREKVEDIEHAAGAALNRIFLENLSSEVGVELLRSLGVRGTDNELTEAVKEFDGHALALSLLGTYLFAVHSGEIRRRDRIPHVISDKLKQGMHARNVMAAYENHLKGTPELDVLRVLGLFDRPADDGAIEVLQQKPAIRGVTEAFVKLSSEDYKFALHNLRDLRLVAPQDEDRRGIVDCHPLLREHFGEKLAKENPKGWSKAHSRLYEYYKNLPSKMYPDTMKEMEPLFQATIHGCRAGQYKETLEDVYYKRISRGEDCYAAKMLGAFSADLAALSGFFSEPWSKLVPDLGEDIGGFVLGFVAFDLRALGRLTEAVELYDADLAASIKAKVFAAAATTAGSLSEICLVQGSLERALEYARRSVELTQKGGVYMSQGWKSRGVLGNALLQAGQGMQAGNELAQAEQMFIGHMRQYLSYFTCLCSMGGFVICDLLLSQGLATEVRERATGTLKWAKAQKRLLDMALDELSLGRAYMLEAVRAKSKRFRQVADGFLHRAVQSLRDAGAQEFIIRGLLSRAELYRDQRDWGKAWRDLEEVAEIAERGEMNLYLADYHLEAARVCLAEGKKEKEAREHSKEAKERIEKMGYHRRDPEVMLIEAELELVEGNKEAAVKKLDEAKECIDKMGCHRWDVEVERLKGKQ